MNSTGTTLIGCRIAAARTEAGWTQLELSESLGVTRWTVSRWERGTKAIPVRVLLDMSCVLDVDAGALLPTRKQWRADRER